MQVGNYGATEGGEAVEPSGTEDEAVLRSIDCSMDGNVEGQKRKMA